MYDPITIRGQNLNRCQQKEADWHLPLLETTSMFLEVRALTVRSQTMRDMIQKQTHGQVNHLYLPPRLGLAAVPVNNSIYVIGGKPSLKAYVGGEVEIFHVQADYR